MKVNDVVKLNLNGEVVSGKIVKTWAKMKDKVGIEVFGFNYMKTNYRCHVIDRTEVLKS